MNSVSQVHTDGKSKSMFKSLRPWLFITHVTLGIFKKEEKYQGKILLLKRFNKHYSNELKEQRNDNLTSDYCTDWIKISRFYYCCRLSF